MLSKRVSFLSYAIREIAARARILERQGKKIVYLNIGDPLKYDYRVPQAFVDGVKKNLDKGFYAPSEGVYDLREAIVRWEAKKGVQTEVNNVFVTHGVSEAIFGLMSVTLDPGDEIILPRPVYPVYSTYSRFFGAKIKFYDGINPDIEQINEMITEKTKFLVMINPNNPTGVVYSKETVKGFADLSEKVAVISDEIYDLLTFDRPAENIGKFAEENIVVLNGFSKTFLAPGYRLGYAYFFGADKLKEAMLKFLRARLATNTPVQYGAVEAINEGGTWIKPLREKLKKRRDVAYEGIKKAGLTAPKPEGAFYLFPFIKGDDKKFVFGLLEEEGIAVVYGSGFDHPEAFRLVFLPDEKTLEGAVQKIADFLDRHPEFKPES